MAALPWTSCVTSKTKKVVKKQKEQIAGFELASTVSAPPATDSNSVIWTGEQMIVFGGSSADPHVKNPFGGVFMPTDNVWRSLTRAQAPHGRRDHTAVWTGAQMVVWGGSDLSQNDHKFADGAIYEPELDKWSSIKKDGA